MPPAFPFSLSELGVGGLDVSSNSGLKLEHSFPSLALPPLFLLSSLKWILSPQGHCHFCSFPGMALTQNIRMSRPQLCHL